MRFKYPQFLVLLVFIIPMLACNSFFGSDDEPESSSSAPADSESDSSLAVSADSENATDDSAQQESVSADSQPSADGSSSATTIQPVLAMNSDALPFQTYRAEMVMSTTSGDNVASMTFISQRDLPNKATSYEVKALGVPDMEDFGGGTMSVVIIDGMLYVPFEGECMAISADGNTPLDQFLQGSDEFFDEKNLQVSFLADETLLGLPVKTYAVTELGDNELTNVDGNVSVYTADDGRDIVLKAEMTGTSAINPMTDAPENTTISYSFSVTDADIALNIEAPEGCDNAFQMPNIGELGTAVDVDLSGGEGSQSNGEFPLYPGAELLVSGAGMQSFTIPQSAVDAAQISPRDHFVEAFTALGYSIGQEFAAGPSTTITFEGNGSSIQVVIVEESGSVSVTVLGLP